MFEIRREAVRRLTICKECPSLTPAKLGWKCADCGCYVKPKSLIPQQKCPLGKWQND